MMVVKVTKGQAECGPEVHQEGSASLLASERDRPLAAGFAELPGVILPLEKSVLSALRKGRDPVSSRQLLTGRTAPRSPGTPPPGLISARGPVALSLGRKRILQHRYLKEYVD